MNFTQQQQDFINATKTGASISVQAAPGSGKTFISATALKELNTGAIALAFNTHSAKDLRDYSEGRYSAFSFHQIGNAISRANLTKGYLNIDENKYGYIIGDILGDVFSPDQREFWVHRERILDIFNLWRSHGAHWITFEDFAASRGMQSETFYFPILNEMLQRGIKKISQPYKGKIMFDYTDTVFLPNLLDWGFPSGARIGNKGYGVTAQEFPTILVDESNDLTFNYIGLVRKLNPNAQFIFIGDPNQSINAWAGALENSFTYVEEEFKTEKHQFSTVFRCPGNHVDLLNEEFPDFGTLTAFKGDGILEDIPEFNISKFATDDSCIMFRNFRGADSPALRVFITLLNKGIHANIAGLDFLSLTKRLTKMAAANSEEKIPFKDLGAAVDELRQTINPRHSDAEDKLNEIFTVSQLLEFATRSGMKSLDTFYKFLKNQEYAKGPILTTGHKTKGLQWNTTIVFPMPRKKVKIKQTDAQILQERQLRYVMLSRSQQEMYLVN